MVDHVLRGRRIVFGFACIVLVLTILYSVLCLPGTRRLDIHEAAVSLAMTVFVMLFICNGRAWAKWVWIVLSLTGLVVWLAAFLPHMRATFSHCFLGSMIVTFAVFGLVLWLSPSVAAFISAERANRAKKSSSSPSAPVAPADGSVPAQAVPAKSDPVPLASEFAVLLILVSMALLIWAVCVVQGHEPSHRLGEKTGNALVIGLIAAALARFVLKGKAGAGIVWFAVVFCVFSYESTLGVLRWRIRSREPKALLEAAILEGLNGKGMEEGGPNSSGTMHPATRIVREYLGRVERDVFELGKETREQGIETLIATETLMDPSELAEARVSARKILLILAKYEKSYAQALSDMRCKMAALPVQTDEEKQVLKEFDVMAAQWGGLMSEYYRIETALVSEMGALLDSMVERRGKYSLHGKRITFDSQRDAETFNKHMETIQRLKKEESAWQDKIARQIGEEERTPR